MEAIEFLTLGLVLATFALSWQTGLLVVATKEFTKQQKKVDKRTKLAELISLVWKIQEINVNDAGTEVERRKLPEQTATLLRRLEEFRPYLQDSFTEQYLTEVLIALRNAQEGSSIGANRETFETALERLKGRLIGMPHHLPKWQRELMSLQPT